MLNSLRLLSLGVAVLVSMSVSAGDFSLKSADIKHGDFMPKAQEFRGFGCEGGNASPQLSWSGAPKGTEAFALFVYDPDAPTGSGWWHWQLVNIPKDASSLVAGAGSSDSKTLPEGSQNLKNDYGSKGFGGACPPNGHGAHRYQFTLHALSSTLDIPEGASSALVGYLVNARTIEIAKLEALYKRD